jgi:hypothetical protein
MSILLKPAIDQPGKKKLFLEESRESVRKKLDFLSKRGTQKILKYLHLRHHTIKGINKLTGMQRLSGCLSL